MTTRRTPKAHFPRIMEGLFGPGPLDRDSATFPVPTFRDAGVETEWSWASDLTAGQAATFDAVALAAVNAGTIEDDRFDAVRADVATLRGFLSLATPTAAERNAAFLAHIRLTLAIGRYVRG